MSLMVLKVGTPLIFTTELPVAAADITYDEPILITGNGTVAVDISAGALPPGWTIDAQVVGSGVRIGGIGHVGGSYSFTVRANNGLGVVTRAFVLGVIPAVPTLTPLSPSYTSQQPTLVASWQTGSTGVDFEIHLVSDGSTVASVTGDADGSWTPSTLTNFLDYYFTARSRNTYGVSAWAPSSSFSVSTASLKIDNYWAFDESSPSGGTTRVDLKNAKNLTASAGKAPSSTGKFNNAAHFVASNSDLLTRASETALQVGDIEFEAFAWIKIDSLTGNSFDVLFGKVNDISAAANVEWAVYAALGSGGLTYLRARVSNDGVSTPTTLNDPLLSITEDVWHFVRFRHDPVANTIGISIDLASFVTVAHTGGIVAGTNSFHVGGTGTASQYCNADIDQLMIIKGEFLTDPEWANIYNTGAGKRFPFTEPLAGFDAFPVDFDYNSLDIASPYVAGVDGGGVLSDNPLYLQVTTSSSGYAQGTLHYLEIAVLSARLLGRRLIVDFIDAGPFYSDSIGLNLLTPENVSFGAFYNPQVIEIRGETHVEDAVNCIFKDMRFRAGWSPASYAAGIHIGANWQALELQGLAGVVVYHCELLEGEDDSSTVGFGADEFYLIESIVAHTEEGQDGEPKGGAGKAFSLTSSPLTTATGTWDRIGLLNSIFIAGHRAPRVNAAKLNAAVWRAQIIGCITGKSDSSPNIDGCPHLDMIRNTIAYRTSEGFNAAKGDIYAYGTASEVNTKEQIAAAAEVYLEGNRAIRMDGSVVTPPVFGTLTGSVGTGKAPLPTWGTPHADVFTSVPSRTVTEHYDYALANAGCLPAARDALSTAIISSITNRNWVILNHPPTWFLGYDASGNHVRGGT